MSVIGGFGFPFLASYVKVVMLILCVLCIGSVVLFDYASKGWTSDSDDLQKYEWSRITGKKTTLSAQGLTLEGDFEATQYVGLQGAYTVIEIIGPTFVRNLNLTLPAGFIPTKEQFVAFDDTTLCVTPNCPSCYAAGKSVYQLVIISAVLSSLVIVISLMRGFLNDSYRKKIAALVLSFISIALSVAAFSTWHISCILKSKDTAQLSNAHFQDKIGYSATAGGFVIMGVVLVFQLLTPLRVDRSHLDVKALAAPLFGSDGGFQRSDKATDFGIAGATELSVKTTATAPDNDA